MGTAHSQSWVLSNVAWLQRLGGVADALATAYTLIRPEVQSEALPPKVRALSPALACRSLLGGALGK